MTKNFRKNISTQVAVVVAALLILPGCSIFDKMNMSSSNGPLDVVQDANMAQDTSRPIVTMNGTPLVTQEMLEQEKRIIESNPQVKQMIAMMPPAVFERTIVEGMANREIITRYIKDKGVDQLPAYKAELDHTLRSIPQALNLKYFTESMPVSIPDKDVREFYDKNKQNIPQLVATRGGIVSKGISFSDESQAKAFFEKASKEHKDIQKAADMMNMADNIQDFKEVNEYTNSIDPVLKKNIMEISSFPALKMFTLPDGTFWVVQAISKEELKYHEFDQVKHELRKYLEQEQRPKMIEQQIEKLKSEYGIVTDETYFAAQQPEADEQPSFDAESMEDDSMDMSQEDQAYTHQTAQQRTVTPA